MNLSLRRSTAPGVVTTLCSDDRTCQAFNTTPVAPSLVHWQGRHCRPPPVLALPEKVGNRPLDSFDQTVSLCQRVEVTKLLIIRALPLRKNRGSSNFPSDNRVHTCSIATSQFFFTKFSFPWSTPKTSSPVYPS